MNSHLDEKTLEKRLKMAEGFYRKYFESELVSAEVTSEKLQAVSSDYSLIHGETLEPPLPVSGSTKGSKMPPRISGKQKETG